MQRKDKEIEKASKRTAPGTVEPFSISEHITLPL